MTERTTPERHELYERIHASEEFQTLRKHYRGFAFPTTVAFMVWYLLFVVSANWAPGFMHTTVVGTINVAFLFGVLQFASTFLIAWLYARHANKKLDPIADRLQNQYHEEVER